jgi:glycosyltransferase involved in cell wall biosynthesis
MKKVLFISHDAYRAGAQLLLLELLIHLRENSDIEFEILFREEGELLPEFNKIAVTHIWKTSTNQKFRSNFLREYLAKKRNASLIQTLKQQRFDLIISNTITNGFLLRELSILNIPIITYVHELSYWIEKFGTKNLEYVKSFTDRYIAVSEAVKINLVVNCQLPENKITIFNEFTNFFKINNNQLENGLKKAFGLSSRSLIVGACGREYWRKGKDLFIPVAIQVLKKTDIDVHFIWIGGEMSYELKFDLAHSGYKDKIHFIDHLPDAYKYFNDFDLFLMLSREDPFPVVNLEVASLCKTILCFENSGGTPEFLSGIDGVKANYMDIEDISRKIIFFLNNKNERIKIGKQLAERVCENYDIKIIAKRIESLINHF